MTPIEYDLYNAFCKLGLTPPGEIIIDGKIHRFDQPDKRYSTSSWYVFFQCGKGVAGCIGDFRLDVHEKVYSWAGSCVSQAEQDLAAEKIAQAVAKAEDDKRRQYNVAARICTEKLLAANPASRNHPYLVRKAVQPHGCREDESGDLLISVTDIDGFIMSLQTINYACMKRFFPTARMKGGMHVIDGKRSDAIYLVEGWATGASVVEHTGHTTICCFSSGNLPEVAKIVRQRYPDIPMAIIADHDEAGIKAANKAAETTGAKIWYPPVPGYDFNDWVKASGVCA